MYPLSRKFFCFQTAKCRIWPKLSLKIHFPPIQSLQTISFKAKLDLASSKITSLEQGMELIWERNTFESFNKITVLQN